jgi:DNA-binding XRE family transcriptional regulator
MTVAIPPHLTGLDLKVRRIAAGITATALANEIGVGRTSVTNAERELRPSPYRIRVYLESLERIASR